MLWKSTRHWLERFIQNEGWWCCAWCLVSMLNPFHWRWIALLMPVIFRFIFPRSWFGRSIPRQFPRGSFCGRGTTHSDIRLKWISYLPTFVWLRSGASSDQITSAEFRSIELYRDSSTRFPSVASDVSPGSPVTRRLPIVISNLITSSSQWALKFHNRSSSAETSSIFNWNFVKLPLCCVWRTTQCLQFRVEWPEHIQEVGGSSAPRNANLGLNHSL